MTDDRPIHAKWDDVLREVQACAGTWHPDARILGNIRADDIATAISQAFSAIDELSKACGFPIVDDRHQVMETIGKRIRRLTETVDKLRSELKERSDQGCASGHVILEAGVEPGISYPCRCEECRDVAIRMADAGYLDSVKDRWWESQDAGVECRSQAAGQSGKE